MLRWPQIPVFTGHKVAVTFNEVNKMIIRLQCSRREKAYNKFLQLRDSNPYELPFDLPQPSDEGKEWWE